MLFSTFVFLATWFGLYLAVAVVGGSIMGFQVLGDMRGKWPQLSALQWCAVPAIMLYYALWHGLRWPAYAWAGYQRDRKLVADIRRLQKPCR